MGDASKLDNSWQVDSKTGNLFHISKEEKALADKESMKLSGLLEHGTIEAASRALAEDMHNMSRGALLAMVQMTKDKVATDLNKEIREWNKDSKDSSYIDFLDLVVSRDADGKSNPEDIQIRSIPVANNAPVFDQDRDATLDEGGHHTDDNQRAHVYKEPDGGIRVRRDSVISVKESSKIKD